MLENANQRDCMNEVLKRINEMFDEAIKNADSRSLGKILKDKRKEMSLELEDISKTSEISTVILAQIESDMFDDMNISTMKRLCYTYELSPNVFISRLGRSI